MTKTTPYLLESKPYQPIIESIENHQRAQVLCNSIAIYDVGKEMKVVLSMNDTLSKIIEAHGAEQMGVTNILSMSLKRETESYALLYGNPKALVFLKFLGINGFAPKPYIIAFFIKAYFLNDCTLSVSKDFKSRLCKSNRIILLIH